MKNYDEWKRKLYERAKTEIFSGLSWEDFSPQLDNFVYVYGDGAIRNGQIPPHGKYEIWLPNKLEHEFIKIVKEAAINQGLMNEQKQKENNP